MLATAGSTLSGPGGNSPSPPVWVDLRMEPEAFRRLDGHAIWVVGSGSASALEGKVIVPLGSALVLLACWSFAVAMASREGDGVGKVREGNGTLQTSWSLKSVRAVITEI